VHTNWRFKLALIHRINQKEILHDQIRLLAILLRIVARIKEGATIREAYTIRVQDTATLNGEELEVSEEDVLLNRLKLRRYLQELSHY
jgi:hypothetical protein